MPYKVTKRTMLTVDGFRPYIPFQDAYLEKNTLVDRIEIQTIRGRKMARVKTLESQVRAREGWVENSLVLPVYGQTEKRGGIILQPNQEAIDLCRRFSKQLDIIYQRNPTNVQTNFMIGILVCMDLDRRKKCYAAISGNWGLPPGWENAAEKIGCIPAPSLANNFHMRNISGKIISAQQPGPRCVKEVKRRFGGDRPNTDWNKENPPLGRRSNLAGTCAAQKMLQMAFKYNDDPRYLLEQWYDSSHGPHHSTYMKSCPTCQVNISRMLKR